MPKFANSNLKQISHEKDIYFPLVFDYYANFFSQTLKWVKQAGTPSKANNANAIATDASGNTYVTSNFSGVTNFGGITLTPFSIDIFIAKYNNAGTFQWVKQAGSANKFTSGQGVAADVSGNVYTTGYFSGITDFGGTSLSPVGTQDIFIGALQQCPLHPHAHRHNHHRSKSQQYSHFNGRKSLCWHP